MKLSLLTLTLTLAACVGSAHAMCGGGGFAKHPATTPTTAAVAPVLPLAEIVDLNESAQVMSVKAGPVQAAAGFDSAHFIKLTATMNLSNGQRKEITAATSQIQTRLEGLTTAFVKAQNDLINCQGRCDSAGKKLDTATRELNKFDPNQAFADRLSQILNPAQFAQLENAERTSKRQGI